MSEESSRLSSALPESANRKLEPIRTYFRRFVMSARNEHEVRLMEALELCAKTNKRSMKHQIMVFIERDLIRLGYMPQRYKLGETKRKDGSDE